MSASASTVWLKNVRDEISGRCRASIDIIPQLVEALWLPLGTLTASQSDQEPCCIAGCIGAFSEHHLSFSHFLSPAFFRRGPLPPPLLILFFLCSPFVRPLPSYPSKTRPPSIPRSFRPRASYSYLPRNYQVEEILGKRYAVKRPDLDWKKRIGRLPAKFYDFRERFFGQNGSTRRVFPESIQFKVNKIIR